MPRRERNDLAQLARTSRMQLARAQSLGHTLDAIASAARKIDPLWQPDHEWRQDFKEITSTISQCGAALTKALEANERALALASDEALEVQLKAELLRMAENFTLEEWAIIDNARHRQAKYRPNFRPRGRPPKPKMLTPPVKVEDSNEADGPSFEDVFKPIIDEHK